MQTVLMQSDFAPSKETWKGLKVVLGDIRSDMTFNATITSAPVVSALILTCVVTQIHQQIAHRLTKRILQRL